MMAEQEPSRRRSICSISITTTILTLIASLAATVNLAASMPPRSALCLAAFHNSCSVSASTRTCTCTLASTTGSTWSPSSVLRTVSSTARRSTRSSTAATCATRTTCSRSSRCARPAVRLYGSKTGGRNSHPRKLDKASATKSAATDGSATGSLSWESFDFSTNPKLDNRFAGRDDENGQSLLNRVARGEDSVEDFARVTKLEALKDRAAGRQLDQINEAYAKLAPQLVAEATAVLEPYVNPSRLDRIYSILERRTKRVKFLFENPSNPSNVWACLRTIDSFGVQNVDVIIDSGMYEGKMAISQKSGMRTAMGSAKWLTLRNHMSTGEAVERIRKQGYTIYASDLNPDSVDVRDLDWNEDDGDDGDGNAGGTEKRKDRGPICVVMGNEERGISDEMRELADVTFTLPMCGFAESFNLSVATSITLAHMSAKSDGEGKGPLRPGDLDEHELACLKLKGLLGSLPQRRMGKSLLKQKGIVLPDAVMALL